MSGHYPPPPSCADVQNSASGLKHTPLNRDKPIHINDPNQHLSPNSASTDPNELDICSSDAVLPLMCSWPFRGVDFGYSSSNRAACCTPDDGTCEQKKARRWEVFTGHTPPATLSAPLFLAPELNSLITGRPPAGSDRFGDGQPPSGSALAESPTSLFRFYTKAGCLLFFTGSAAWFYLGLRTSTLFRSILRVTRTLDTTPSHLQPQPQPLHLTAVPTARDLLHGGDPLLSTHCPPVQSTSRTQNSTKPLVEKEKIASAIGAVLIRTYERKAEANHFDEKELVPESRLAAFGPLQTDRRVFAPVVTEWEMEAQRVVFSTRMGWFFMKPIVNVRCGCGGGGGGGVLFSKW
ncbi:hypothetical protein B0T20DRAFT_499820 [Sordaria brevicollis]|uniref:Uncharacterized protein n=1 Tax=Sordaria brevicollis TaxID=83679 RepID=A0AAE0UBF6_SORBR|nr:hypothetical protein B0T20DRAFT_499820 [Sordaria brevicollis]